MYSATLVISVNASSDALKVWRRKVNSNVVSLRQQLLNGQ